MAHVIIMDKDDKIEFEVVSYVIEELHPLVSPYETPPPIKYDIRIKAVSCKINKAIEVDKGKVKYRVKKVIALDRHT